MTEQTATVVFLGVLLVVLLMAWLKQTLYGVRPTYALGVGSNGGGGQSKTEQFNQLIRGSVVLIIVLGMNYGFIVSKVVSTESYMIVAILVFNWWFKGREDEKKASDTLDAVKAATAPAIVAIAKAEERAATAEAKAAPVVTTPAGIDTVVAPVTVVAPPEKP